MKSIKKYIMSLGVAAAALTMGSCTGDLDLTPIDPSSFNSSAFAEDPEGYMDRVLAEVYASFAVHGPNNNSQVSGFDGGMSTYQRCLFNLQEVPTDEACWLSSGDEALYTLTVGSISADNTAIFGAYSRMIINVALCNSFIQTVQEGLFGLPENLQAKAADAIRQCKILRSAVYYDMIDLFGSVPYADETVAIGTNAPQLSREQIFGYVTQTLEEVVAEYGNSDELPAYGYVGKDVAQALLMRFYLNAEVYTGTPRWNDALKYAKALIDSHQGKGFQGSGLTNSYLQNFSANNRDYVTCKNNGRSEILWFIPMEYNKILSYGGASLMIRAMIEKTPENLAFFNVGNAWMCSKGRPEFVSRFEWNEPSRATSPDKRTALWRTSKDGFVFEMQNTVQADWHNNGYETPKWLNRNVNDNGEVDMVNTPPSDNDGMNQTGYAVIRLAEAYLSAAEACLRGAGSKADALKYVNVIRQRAGLNAWNEGQLNLETLLDERSRELYMECTRRSDLIRNNKWISGYNWAWKGGTEQGGDLRSNANLYPIPSDIINQSSYQQNPGY